MENIEQLIKAFKQEKSNDLPAQADTKVELIAAVRESLGAVERLIEALDDSDSGLVLSLAQILARTGKEATPLLVAALKDPHPNRRRGAATALMLQSFFSPQALEPVTQLLLHDPDEIVRDAVAFNFVFSLPCANQIGPELIKALVNEDLQTGYRAAEALRHGWRPPIPELVAQLLSDPASTSQTRYLALFTFDKMWEKYHSDGMVLPRSIDFYAQFLTDSDPVVRRQAVLFLSHLAAPVELFLPLTNDPDEQVRQEVQAIISRLDPGNPIGVQWLIEQIRNMDTLFARTNEGTPQQQKEANQQLKQIWAAIDQLAKLRPAEQQTAEAFIKLFLETRNSNSKSHSYARSAMEKLGANAHTLVPQLLETLSNDNESEKARSEAAGLLGAVGTNDKNVVAPLLEAFTRESNPYTVRVCAVIALGKLGPATASAALPTLKTELSKVKPELGLNIAEALGRLEPTYTPALDYLIAIIDKGSDPKLTERAVFALDPFGPAGKAALPALVKLFTTSKSEPTDLNEVVFGYLFSKLDKETAKEQLRQALEEYRDSPEVASRIRNTLRII